MMYEKRLFLLGHGCSVTGWGLGPDQRVHIPSPRPGEGACQSSGLIMGHTVVAPVPPSNGSCAEFIKYTQGVGNVHVLSNVHVLTSPSVIIIALCFYKGSSVALGGSE